MSFLIYLGFSFFAYYVKFWNIARITYFPEIDFQVYTEKFFREITKYSRQIIYLKIPS